MKHRPHTKMNHIPNTNNCSRLVRCRCLWVEGWMTVPSVLFSLTLFMFFLCISIRRSRQRRIRKKRVHKYLHGYTTWMINKFITFRKETKPNLDTEDIRRLTHLMCMCAWNWHKARLEASVDYALTLRGVRTKPRLLWNCTAPRNVHVHSSNSVEC